jgi:hypothetical protein
LGADQFVDNSGLNTELNFSFNISEIDLLLVKDFFEKNKKLAADKVSAKSAIPSMSGAGIEKALGVSKGTKKDPVVKQSIRESLKFTPSMAGDENVVPQISETIKVSESPYESLLSSPAQKAEKDIAMQQAADKSQQSKNQQMLGKGLGLLGNAAQSIGNYAIPFQQYKMGQKFLAETGKRPVDKIDPDFQNAVTKAQANAQFGYTPQEQSLLDQQNVNALRAGQNAAKNFSGGSAANAYNLTRDAANQYVGRGLKNLIGGKQLQMEKQQVANDMIQNKSEMNRRLFNDSMNAWNANQQAGQSLVGMGLQNLIGANRLNKEYAFQNKLANNSNPYSDSYANSLINYNG